jgi:hypothetical protein
LVSLAVALGFLAFLVARFDVDLGATWGQVRAANLWYLALAVVVHYTNFLFRGLRWRLLIRNAQGRDKPAPGVIYCSELILLGWFVNSVAWLRLGDFYRAYLYRDEGQASFALVMGTIVSERLLGTALIVLLLLVSVPFLVSGGGDPMRSGWAVLVVGAVLLAALALMVLAVIGVKERLKRWLPAGMARHYEGFYQGTRGSLRQVPLLSFWGLLGWLSEVGRLYFVTQALGLSLDFPLVVFITVSNSLLSLVPTPGGVGAVESGVAGLLVRLSPLAAPSAAALVLVDRSISYISIIITGAVVFLLRQAYPRTGVGSKATTAKEHLQP